MGVIIGNRTNGGWTTIDPKRDSNTSLYPTWSSQFGINYNGDGTRFLFFAETTSSPAGSIGGLGTPASPLSGWWLINPYYNKARHSFPDWFLFKKQTIFTNTSQAESTNPPFGPTNTALYGSFANLATFFPMVITCYDPAAPNNPPLFNPPSGGALPFIRWDGSNSQLAFLEMNSGQGKNMAVGGINVGSTLSDPQHPEFTGQYWGGAFLLPNANRLQGGFLLVEDCGCRFSGWAINGDEGYTYIRRNRFRYNAGSGVEGQGENNQGQDQLFEENLLDCSGWWGVEAVTCNTSTDVFTFVSPPTSLEWKTNCRVKLFARSGQVLPAPLEPAKSYWTRNVSGNTFQVALTINGAPINLTGGTVGVNFYILSSDAGRVHNWYGGYGAANSFGRLLWDRNIFSNDCYNSFQRGGGRAHNNLFYDMNTAGGYGSAKVGVNTEISWNVVHNAAGGLFAEGVNYQFSYGTVSGLDFTNNIVAHNIGWGIDVAFGYNVGASGGTFSHNIVYDWSSYGGAFASVGWLRTFTVVNPGTGGDGRVLTFHKGYNPGSGGTQSLDTLVGGSGGTPGTYRDVLFTGGSGTGVRGDVDVGAGGNVTAVRLTQAGDLAAVSGDTLTGNWNSSGIVTPSSWSFKIRPYTIEMRLAGGEGTGCRVYGLVTFDGQIHQPTFGVYEFVGDLAGCGTWLSRTANTPADVGAGGAVNAEERGFGGLKLVAGGTRYSTGQVLTPFGTPTGGPSGGAVPTGFQITVGPYPQITRVDNIFDGIALGDGSISGHHDTGDGNGLGGLVSLDFQTVGGVTRVVDAHPFVFKGEHGYGCDPGHCGGYVVDDVCSVANVAGMSGVVLRVASVCTNTDDGTNAYNGAVKPWMVSPYNAPNRNMGTYMTFLGNPGGYPSTEQGFLDAVEKLQTRSTWSDLLTADSYNDYVRQGMGMPMFGSGYASLVVGGIFLNPLPSSGQVGVGYSGSAAASGGTAPYSYAVTTGSLPPGLALTPGTGAVTGTPSTAGTYNFRITATDAVPASSFRDYSVVIAPAAVGGPTYRTVRLAVS